MTRSFSAPRPIQVRVDDAGQPHEVVWRGRRERVRVCNLWLSEVGWWNDHPPRAYYKLLTRSKTVLVVYQEETRWYVERILD